ncbi:hypothetical protein GBA52_001734 [Prunus armeniaca]|nr:hypothetical protein GBA52_001734 [Prunus armeniaca]
MNSKTALTKSIIFLEAQRSGKLPTNNRLAWRGDSAIDDGKQANVRLSFSSIRIKSSCHTVTLSHDILPPQHVQSLRIIRGDPKQDHQCWVRPEDMQTPRTVLEINEKTPGTEIAAETSAAMAASAIVFRSIDRVYSRRLLNKAKLLFQLAKSHKGTYDGECPFYCSYSGYNDELLWAATWLYMASGKPMYLKYIQEEAISANVNEFSWDLKYAGAQILLSPSVYSDLLAQHNQKVNCGGKQFDSVAIATFAKKQMDYPVGPKPKGRSYMVGFGPNAPKQPHHRGASVPTSGK